MIIKKPIFIASVSFIIILICFVLLLTNNSGSMETKEWKDFRKQTMDSNSFIKDMSIEGFEIYLNVSYKFEKEVDEKDVKIIFEKTRSFLLTKKVFEEIQQTHLKVCNNNISEIYIDFFHLETGNKRDYRFYSSQDVSGKAQYDTFKKWSIEYKDEESKEYIPIS